MAIYGEDWEIPEDPLAWMEHAKLFAETEGLPL